MYPIVRVFFDSLSSAFLVTSFENIIINRQCLTLPECQNGNLRTPFLKKYLYRRNKNIFLCQSLTKQRLDEYTVFLVLNTAQIPFLSTLFSQPSFSLSVT